MTDAELRVAYCKEKNVHHLFELLATKVLQERPDNIFSFLHTQLTSIEEAESKSHSHDPSKLRSTDGGLLKVTLAIFGLDNAGKTALLSAMGGQVDANTTPTVGFSPVQFQTDRHDLCIFDLGGGQNFRGIWSHYFHDCHGMIYVMDAADEKRLEESAKLFKEVVQNKYMRGKPVLIFANKKDLTSSRGLDTMEREVLKLNAVLEPGTDYKVLPTCAIREDPTVEDGVTWILAIVEKHYEALSAKVTQDTAEVRAEKKRKLAEQQARVDAMRSQSGAEQ